MSKFDERLEEELKKLEEEKKKKKKQAQTKDPATTIKKSLIGPGVTAVSAVRDISPTVSQNKDDDIAPVLLSNLQNTYKAEREKEEEKKDKGWFQSGAFDDGYQFGDVTKTILGSATDLLEDVGTGLIGMGEKAVDAFATISPYVMQSQMSSVPVWDEKLRKQQESLVKQAQEETEEFVAKDLYDEQEIARTILTKPVQTVTGIDVERSSVFGQKSDSLAQSLGQLGGTLGLQAVGVPWFMTTGVTTFGGEAENALKQGASLSEAMGSGLVSAGAEILTEKLFGGSGLGETGLFNTELLTKGISNKLVKSLADFGVDIGAEGMEEVFSELAGNLGSSLYKEENLGDILFSEEAIEGYIDSFIGGGVLGGIMNSSKFVSSAKKGTDYRQEYTQNEQKVFDKVYEERLAEAQKNGKVTQKQKAEIYDSVVRDIEKGYISTETIEEVLGGENFTQYKNLVDSENALTEKQKVLQEEFAELSKMKQGEMTGEQVDRRAELKEELAKLNETIKSQQNHSPKLLYQQRLSESVSELVKNDRLAESYNERARRGQAYEADLTQYDAKQQKIIQKAIDSGVLNNTRRTHEFVDMVAKISADKGVLFDFTNNAKLKESGFAKDGKVVNGYVTKDGITVNMQSAKYVNSVVGHEITHVLEGTELYTELQNTLFEYAKSKNDYQGRYDTLTKLYEGVEGANIEAELTADLVGDYLFTDSDFINRLSTANRNVFQKIYDEVKYLFKIATAGSKEARQLEKVKKAFDEAYRASGEVSADTKYSLEQVDGVDYVKAEKNIFTKEDGTVASEREVFDSLVGKKITLSDGEVEIVNRLPGKKMYDELYRRYPKKLGGVADPNQLNSDVNYNMEELLGNSTARAVDIPDKGNKHAKQGITSFDTRTVKFYDGDKAYDIVFSIATLQDGKKVAYAKKFYGYDAELTKKIQTAEARGQQSSLNQQSVSEGTLPQGNENVKAQFSLSDSSGRQLTSEQNEYFKDSKVRDENGNLKVMYHGTSQGGHTMFDPYGKARYGLFGAGSYFTDSKSVAESYTKKGKGNNPQVYETYLNITNPMDMDAQADAEAWKKAFPDAYFPESGTNEDFYRAMEEYFEDEQYARWEASEVAMSAIEGMGYDGITHIGGGRVNANSEQHRVYIAFTPEQIKNTDNSNPTSDPDIRYSLSDSQGRQLTSEQADYFQNSKARDENGSLAVVYHGTRKADFTVFKRNATYFTDNKEMADSYSPNGEMYEGYVNITKPYEIDAAGEKWSKIPIDAETKKFLQEYGASVFKEGGKWRTTPADIVSAIEEAVDNGDMDYDGIIIRNIDDTGSYYKGKGTHLATDYIVFNSNQFKNADNKTPTADPDIRFSLSETVEETKDLMALHNLTEEKLRKTLKLGGLPMPSVAIARARDGHDEFGDITLILHKDAIDPKTSRKNKLYSGDAWTPTYPSVDYKVDEKVLRNISKKLYGLVPSDVLHDLGRISLDSDNMADTLNRWGGDVVTAFGNNDALKYAYLVDNGADIELPMKEKRISYGSRENGEIIRVAEAIPADEIKQALNGASAEMRKLEPRVRQAVTEYWQDAYGDDPGALELLIPKEELSFSELDGYLTDAMRYHRSGVERTVDTRAARTAIADQTIQTEYEKWLEQTFAGIIEKEGIRNNKDYFTPSGNRRSFEALHYEHNLENVIKAMQEKGEKGIGTFGGSIFGASTTEFSSIAEMKRSGDRLRQIPAEEYEKMRDGFSNRFFEIAQSLPDNKKSFMSADDAANTLIEAVSRYGTSRASIASYLRRELKGWATYSDQAVDDLISLVNDIRNMPTGYFEAKPQRAVGFDEVGVFVVPNNVNPKLKQELLDRGYSIAEYDPNVEGDRQRVVNQFEEYKFSLSNVGEAPVKYGNYRVSGKDLMLEAPGVAENATTTATVSNTESVAPVVVSEMETTTEDLFPDDLAPAQAELEYLEAEAADLQGAMEALAAVGDVEGVNRLIPELEGVKARIAELQAEEAERVGTLDDADVPPEAEAPYPGEPSAVSDPFEDRDMKDVGSQKVKAYQYENPEVKPFFYEAALGLAYDVNNSTHGERLYNDEVYYASGGEKGWMGVKRSTAPDIAAFKDTWKCTWDELAEAVNDIIEDHGKENNALSKRVEFLLNDRLLNGYTDVDGRPYPPNQEYINFLAERQITEYSREAFERFMATADQYAPPAPVEAVVEEAAPAVESDIGPTSEYEAIRPAVKKERYGNKLVRADHVTAEQEQIAQILDAEPTPERRKSRAWARFKAGVLDKGAVFEDLALKNRNRELMGKWNFMLSSEARAQYLMGNGAEGVKSLNAIREKVDGTGKTKEFYEYLYHKHNVDRMQLAQRCEDTPNKPVFGDSVTAEVSQGVVDQYEAQYPAFKQFAQDVYDYMNHLRKLMVDNGVISQETADLWAEMYPHYVPIRRAGDTGLNINVPLDTGRTGVNAPVKRATGGNRDILPLFDTMAQRTVQTYKAIAKNSFGVELKNTLGTTVSSEATNVDEMIDSIDAQEELLQKGKNGERPTFTVFENGEKVTYQITEDMYDALKPVSEGMAYTNKIANTISNLHRGVLTEYNPVFMLTNAIKDAQDVLINSQHPLKTYSKIPEAFAQMVSKGYWYQEYMANGGEQNTYFDHETNTFKTENKGLARLLDIPPLSTISALNNFIEMAPRLGEYIASREAGRSVEVSMLDAARVTTNFAAGGDLTKFLNRNGATFLNASVQGFMQNVRNFREANANGVKGWVSLATKFAVAGLPAVILNNLVWDDDEEYAELSDYVKQSYYIVGKTDDGKFIRIPKGRTLAVIQNGIEQISNAATGDDEVDFGAFIDLVISNLAPNNPLDNNILAPIIQAATNTTWYGEDLVPTRLQNLPAAEQYDESTDAFSKWLGEMTNISPVKINYLLDQYTGGLGDTFLPMLTPEAESGDNTFLGNLLAPLKDKFTTDSVMNNQNVSDFYDTKDELAVNANGRNATDEDVLKAKYMNSMNAEISELYAKKREIQNSSLPDDVKYNQVRAIQSQIVALTKESLETYDDVSISGEYATVGDRYYKRNEEGEWQKLSDDQVTKYKVTSAAGDSPYATDGTNHYRWYEKDGEGEWRKISDDELEKQQEVTNGLGISPEDYWGNKEEYDYAYKNPESYAVSKAVGGFKSYQTYSGEMYDIKADKDENGKSISGSRKEKVWDYISGLDISDGEKYILFKNEYNADDTYNYEIIDYLNEREDISYEDMVTILKKLGFDVSSDGTITWD